MNKRLIKIVLVNIKSHLNTIVDLDNGFNVIGGETDEGKSIIMSAVRWVVDNQPVGWQPRPWPELGVNKSAESKVELHFGDGLIVARVRSISENYYQIDGGEKLKSLRSGVPDQVLEVLNMGEANIQLQKDMHFLLNMTGGQVAKKINEVVDLGPMDDAIQKANARIKQTKADRKSNDKNIKTNTEQIKTKEWAIDANVSLTNLEILEGDINSGNEACSKLSDQVLIVKQTRDKLSACGNVAIMAASLKSLTNQQASATDAAAGFEKLHHIAQALKLDEAAKDKLLKTSKMLAGVTSMQAFARILRQAMQSTKGLTTALEGMTQLKRNVKQMQVLTGATTDINQVKEKVEQWARDKLVQEALVDVCKSTTFYKNQLGKQVSDDCVADLQGVWDELQDLGALTRDFSTIKDSVLKEVSGMNTTSLSLKQLNPQLAEEQKNFKEMRANIGECPTCGKT